jgi:hypothetical protein
MGYVAIPAVKDMPLHVLERYVDHYSHNDCCISTETHDTHLKNCIDNIQQNIKQP